jgi:hypothetical protein
MSTSTETITITAEQAGCYLDNHRGHYIGRDMIELAIGYGFIVDELVQFVLNEYDAHHEDDSYPHESLHELMQEAEDWLNSGRADRVPGQNFPPIIPEGYAWGWNDGDFGLYADESEDD